VVDVIEKFMQYVEGWRRGDLEMILGACADDFVYDSPGEGRFEKEEFAAFFKDAYPPHDPASDDEFITVTDVACEERADGEVTAWCWWKDPASSSEGAALARVGPQGVHWQKVATYAELE
jgi:hypothetical protein